ncbi:RHS repeat-associated core domain-containing protein [Pseudomonas putida]|uniref:RHS repeat-associated core domain-containing protein n=1 Tax=Pseudomonas putida (strain W619) TaxID=390235 RepID=B1JC34_PSEPW|nr:RHS repeat-associated core domain-containing protein [Pseudomonas putida]
MKRVNELRDLAWRALSYTAYGYSQKGPGAALGFNGELKDEVLQGYALGNGHRFYCPALMRFFSPDVLSPFGKGGVNTYSYCQGDPVNRSDPTGGAGILKRWPGRVRQVAVFTPVQPINDRVSPELKKGPGKYQLASTVSKKFVEISDSGITGGFSAGPVKGRPIGKSVGVQSQGPTIDELGEYWKDHWHREHRPGTQPMSLSQMTPNHQRAQSTQIGDIERSRAFIRAQVLASLGHW